MFCTESEIRQILKFLDEQMVKKGHNGRAMDSRVRAASPNDEIVISGISGKFPSARNVEEFAEKLYKKVGSAKDTNKIWKSRNEWFNIECVIKGGYGDCDG